MPLRAAPHAPDLLHSLDCHPIPSFLPTLSRILIALLPRLPSALPTCSPADLPTMGRLTPCRSRASSSLFPSTLPCYDEFAWICGSSREETERKEVTVADTKKIADKAERKKLKRAARKKASPKAKRTAPRGSLKKKVKKMVRGQSKR